MNCFKDAVYSLAFQHGNDGVRLLALKFVETTILLFTPHPNGPLPNQQSADGTSKGFNMACIAGGYPVLDASALGQEASKNLGVLLNWLWAPEASSLPCLVAIVIINRLIPSTSFCRSSSSTLQEVLYGILFGRQLRQGPGLQQHY